MRSQTTLPLEMYNIKQAYASRIIHCTVLYRRKGERNGARGRTAHLTYYVSGEKSPSIDELFFSFKSLLRRKIFRANRYTHTRRRQETQPVVFLQNARACFGEILISKGVRLADDDVRLTELAGLQVLCAPSSASSSQIAGCCQFERSTCCWLLHTKAVHTLIFLV